MAAVGRGQLERLDEKVAKKRAINKFYRKAFGELSGVKFMLEAPYGKSNCWLTVILITPEKFGADRETVRWALKAEKINPHPIWPPARRAYASERNPCICNQSLKIVEFGEDQ